MNKQYHFTLDVCATPENAKCQKYFTKKDNGLIQSWDKNTCWMNPPYGRDMGKWVEKAFRESRKGATVVCLVPARTDVKWWHEWAMRGEITFIKGRLKFMKADGARLAHNGEAVRSGRKKAQNTAPFATAFIVFSPPNKACTRPPLAYGMRGDIPLQGNFLADDLSATFGGGLRKPLEG